MHQLNRQRKIFSVDLLVILKLQPPFWSKANGKEQRSFFLLICWPILDNTKEIVFENCSKKYSSWDNYYLWLKYEINFWSQWQVWLVLFFFILFNLFYSSLQTYKNMSNKIEIFENLSVYFLDSHTMYIENMRPVKNSRWSVMRRYTNLRIVWSHTWCMITYVRKILPASPFMSDTFKIFYMCVPPFN